MDGSHCLRYTAVAAVNHPAATDVISPLDGDKKGKRIYGIDSCCCRRRYCYLSGNSFFFPAKNYAWLIVDADTSFFTNLTVAHLRMTFRKITTSMARPKGMKASVEKGLDSCFFVRDHWPAAHPNGSFHNCRASLPGSKLLKIFRSTYFWASNLPNIRSGSSMPRVLPTYMHASSTLVIRRRELIEERLYKNDPKLGRKGVKSWGYPFM